VLKTKLINICNVSENEAIFLLQAFRYANVENMSEVKSGLKTFFDSVAVNIKPDVSAIREFNSALGKYSEVFSGSEECDLETNFTVFSDNVKQSCIDMVTQIGSRFHLAENQPSLIPPQSVADSGGDWRAAVNGGIIYARADAGAAVTAEKLDKFSIKIVDNQYTSFATLKEKLIALFHINDAEAVFLLQTFFCVTKCYDQNGPAAKAFNNFFTALHNSNGQVNDEIKAIFGNALTACDTAFGTDLDTSVSDDGIAQYFSSIVDEDKRKKCNETVQSVRAKLGTQKPPIERPKPPPPKYNPKTAEDDDRAYFEKEIQSRSKKNTGEKESDMKVMLRKNAIALAKKNEHKPVLLAIRGNPDKFIKMVLNSKEDEFIVDPNGEDLGLNDLDLDNAIIYATDPLKWEKPVSSPSDDDEEKKKKEKERQTVPPSAAKVVLNNGQPPNFASDEAT
jgi:hypothetical protein